MAKFLVVHGPNLNLLGKRELAHYGKTSLKSLDQQLVAHAKTHQVTCFQSNAEHEIIEKIQSSLADNIDAMIINPAAFSHTSIAIRDACLAVKIPFFEVHISNIYARETFRHFSYLSDIAQGVVSGFGLQGYFAAIDAAIHLVSNP